jgi:hypothetical protein
MSTITKQWLQHKIADMEAARDEIPFGLDVDDSNTLAALRIALASREAEPYGYVHKAAYELAGSCGLSSDHEAYRDSSTHIAVYTTPPAPAPVPDRSVFEKWWESEHGSPLDSWDSLRTTDGYCDDGIDGQFEAWNACRAAMLQGDDGNSPVIPDGWVACSERMPEVGSTIMVFMDKPQHSSTDYAIATFDKYGFSRAKVTHWQPLPSPPAK